MYFDKSIWNEVIRPAFVVDEKKVRENIAWMADKARHNGLRFRPHFKTHQSADIGNWFRDAGVSSIAVSSVSMARYFAHSGWNDITIAFPVNLREMNDIRWLAYEIGLNLLVDSEESLHRLLSELGTKAGVYIEIDTGYHRSGIEEHDTDRLDRMVASIRKEGEVTFRGFLTHTGQTYNALSVEEICKMHDHSVEALKSLKKRYRADWPELEISLGDTPACSVSRNWEGIDEMRPGNFVFYDLMMLKLGVCHPENLAALVVCPVVSVYHERAEAVLYGGAVHLSKEFIPGKNGEKIFGLVHSMHMGARFEGLPGQMYLSGLSQEHGMVRGDPEAIRRLKPGDLVAVFPVHSCLAADLAGEYLSDSGDILHKMPRLRNLAEE